MTRLLQACLMLGLLWATGCSSTVVRDTKVFTAEMSFFKQAALQQGLWLEKLIITHPECTCADGMLPPGTCFKAAKTMLVAKHRVPWHHDMALYNSGVSEERPPKVPPVVPNPNAVFCGGE